MSMKMTNEEFERLSAIYGSDIDRWPITDRRAARDFSQKNAQTAQRILDAQSSIDTALSHAPKQEANAALEKQILQTFQTQNTLSSASGLWGRLKGGTRSQNHAFPAWGVALALILVFGFVGGYGGYSYTLNQNDSTEILANAFGSDEYTLFLEDSST
jgi:hypothetical protein